MCATIIGSHLAREPTASPVLTKWWNWELTLATNFGNHVQMVIKFGGQILATKSGFVLDCLNEKHRAPLLCYFKLCASFHSLLCIETGVMVQKWPNWGQICFDLCDPNLWPLTWIFCVEITSVNSNYSWKFHDDRWTSSENLFSAAMTQAASHTCFFLVFCLLDICCTIRTPTSLVQKARYT